jgi:hypothetical protein
MSRFSEVFAAHLSRQYVRDASRKVSGVNDFTGITPKLMGSTSSAIRPRMSVIIAGSGRAELPLHNGLNGLAPFFVPPFLSEERGCYGKISLVLMTNSVSPTILRYLKILFLFTWLSRSYTSFIMRCWEISLGNRKHCPKQCFGGKFPETVLMPMAS